MSDPLSIQGPETGADVVETPLVVTSHVGQPPEPPRAERADTAYVVLSLVKLEVPDGSEAVTAWKVVASQRHAKSAESAVRQYAESIPAALLAENGETFVAIPARSWKPIPVKTKTETTLIVGDA